MDRASGRFNLHLAQIDGIQKDFKTDWKHVLQIDTDATQSAVWVESNGSILLAYEMGN